MSLTLFPLFSFLVSMIGFDRLDYSFLGLGTIHFQRRKQSMIHEDVGSRQEKAGKEIFRLRDTMSYMI